MHVEFSTQSFYIAFVQDVTPYMNHSPYTVNPDTSVPRVFHLFRSMGLRHLPVVNSDGEVSLFRRSVTATLIKCYCAGS